MGRKPLQLTLALFKPDVLRKPYVQEEIKNMILKNGFFIIESHINYPQKIQIENFYSCHQGKPFYTRLINYMLSGPFSSHILARENAILKWREIMGPTKHDKALFEAPNSIRGRFGISDTRNAVHGSGQVGPNLIIESLKNSLPAPDSVETARVEISIMHPTFDYDGWFAHQEPVFRSGQGVLYDYDKSIHVLAMGSPRAIPPVQSSHSPCLKT